jgi:outer membrane protein TolC
MRDLVAQAAESSAELAQRFLDAGNITRLQHAQEAAAAAMARIDAVRAGAEATRARSRLAGLIGLPSSADWSTQTGLPAPLTGSANAAELLPLAVENRLDLAAARQAVALREAALGITRRWRWLGSVELGFERESELDGGVMRGPSLALELPLFNQSQGAIARANSELLQARAELDARLLSVRNEAQLGVEALGAMADIAERYRRELIPQRETIVAESQKEVNFMLIGVFELLRAKQDEYDAYQEYLEAVRDYWTTRAELRRAVGGRLPDDTTSREPAIGVDAILPDPGTQMDMDMEGMDHSSHGAMKHPPATDPSKPMNMPADETAPASSADPHAGHAMPAAPPDPHAGHRMKPSKKQADNDAPAAHEHHGDTP